MNLEGKTALIVGASRGIGLASAELFSKAGANVVISASTHVVAASMQEGSRVDAWDATRYAEGGSTSDHLFS